MANPDPSTIDPAVRDAIRRISTQTGLNPAHLQSVMNLESSLNPRAKGGDGGNYYGLCQLGPNERKQYGMNIGDDAAAQVEPIVNFLRDRAAGVGMNTSQMGLKELYATVLGGNPKANIYKQDSNGTSVHNALRGLQNYADAAAGNYNSGEAVASGGWGVQTASPFGREAALQSGVRDRQPQQQASTSWGFSINS